MSTSKPRPPAWRGVVLDDGTIWTWPTLLMDHMQAFAAFDYLERYMRARWRQWEPNGPVDFDKGASDEDKALDDDETMAAIHRIIKVFG